MDFEEFYAERVVQFERERKIFKDYTALVTPERNESHNLEWENRKLDNAAGDVKVEVDRYARESKTLESQIQATINEINSLKSSRDARREQINRLSKLSNPVQRDVTYIVEERFTAKRASSAPENANQSGKLGSVGPAYKPLKTGELLKMENRLAEETSKTTSYLQDVVLSIREAEEERHRYRKMRVVSNVAALSEAKGLYLQVDETEAQSFLAVSELLRLRVSIMIAQREEIEQLELLQRDKAFFIEREEKTRQQVKQIPVYFHEVLDLMYCFFPSFLLAVNFRHGADATAGEERAAREHAGLPEAVVRAERKTEGDEPEGRVAACRACRTGERRQWAH